MCTGYHSKNQGQSDAIHEEIKDLSKMTGKTGYTLVSAGVMAIEQMETCASLVYCIHKSFTCQSQQRKFNLSPQIKRKS